eukprot:TRINITY_DN1126_c0_g1_i2.p1 TRINITY_DN1126_c0_g1~~TRINITY_DN1126_c0_g1_i2.p1  ORF type:complete len:356 (+),score=73.77 TRINITY_DN1126_c0_g1_i2:41-1108(+)
MLYLLFLLGFVSAVCSIKLGSNTNVTINNASPRVDTQGVIMDVHDGNTFYLNGLYYYYGASYGLCKEPSGGNGCSDAGPGNCGFQLNHNVSLYTSPDFATWTNHGHVFEMHRDHPVPGILFCPKVIGPNLQGDFVLWYNWLPGSGSFASSYYGVAVSPSPLGPFKVVTPNVTSLAFADVGDFSLFRDDDGSGYIIYTSHIQGYPTTHQMSVEKLNTAYTLSLGSSANSGFFGQSFVEAPAMFKRGSTYYAVFGQCCCYCQSGSAVTFYKAIQPLGPYTSGQAISGAIPAQQTNVAQYVGANGQADYIWQGDRWQSAPDGIKGHDLTYWGPMSFDGQGNILPLEFLKETSIVVDTK